MPVNRIKSLLESVPTTIDRVPAVPVESFGKDHWSLVGYVGCRIDSHPAGDAMGVGTLDRRNLRANSERRPHLAHQPEWNPDHGTRLAGYWKEGGGTDSAFCVPQHDDWDCLDDLEAAGILEVLSEINGFVRFTEAGTTVYGALCKHKAGGGNFAEFRWPVV